MYAVKNMIDNEVFPGKKLREDRMHRSTEDGKAASGSFIAVSNRLVS